MVVLLLPYGHTSLPFLIPIMVSRFPLVASLWILMPAAELNGRGKLDGIGGFCDEFSHCMGFPDLYDTGYSGWFGMGYYDLMCAGNYNGDGKCPAGYSAYEKHECGLDNVQDVTDIEEDLNVTGLKAISEGGGANVLKNMAHEDRILHHREPTKYRLGCLSSFRRSDDHPCGLRCLHLVE